MVSKAIDTSWLIPILLYHPTEFVQFLINSLYSWRHNLLGTQREAHSFNCCTIIFDENYVSFFAFKKREVSSDAVEGKTLIAKGSGHNPMHKWLCKTPVGTATPQKQCENLIHAQQRIVRLDKDGQKHYRQNSP